MGRTVSWWRVGWVAVGTAALCALSGCDDSDPAGEAVSKATLELEAVTLRGGTALEPGERRTEGYNAVLASLRSAGTGGPAARASAADSLAAQAHLGLASVAFDAAMDAEVTCLDKAREVRSLQNNWVALKSLQASLEVFDPTDTIAELDADRATRAAEIEAENQKLAALQSDLNDMRERIEWLEEQARGKWEEETRIRRETEELGEVGREPLIREANRIKREGDEFDRQASEVGADLRAREPELRDVEAEINRLTIQSERLTQAIDGLRHEHSEKERLATEAGREAASVADQLTAAVTELDTLREATPAAWEAVTSACEAARSKAMAAGRARGAQELGQVQAGTAIQMLGDALAQQAAGFEAYAGTMRVLGSSAGLPNASQYRQAADEASRRQSELLGEAASTYREAADAFRSAGGEAMEDLAAQLEAKAGELAPEETPAAEPSEPADPGMTPENEAAGDAEDETAG